MTSVRENGTLSFAKEELHRYLAAGGLPEEDMPQICLSLRGEGAEDAYAFEGNAARISVSGSNPRSVLMGCYAYLREIGFAFFAPGKDFTRVPDLSRGLAACRGEARARYFHRGVCIEGSESLDNMLDYIDWMPKAGMNACFVQFLRPDVFFQRWYEHQQNPTVPPLRLTDAELDAFDDKVAREITKRGLMVHRVGHGWTSRALGFAGNGWHEEKDPEDPALRRRIALFRGERRLFGGVPANTNLCYAEPQAQQALVNEVVAYAKAHPETDYLHFWLADTHNNVCECEACARTTLSDQYVHILNLLDEALTREGLPVRIVFLLYQELLYPPLEERIQNPDRFTLMFAPISRTFEAPYPAHPEPLPLPVYRRNAMTLPLNIQENLSYYAAWREIFKGDAFIYDYHLGRAHYGDLGYMTVANTLYRDLEVMEGLGFAGMVACQELRVMMPSAFPIYVMGRALWGDGRSCRQLKDEFFTGLYGPHAPLVTEYFDEVSALCDTDYTNANGPRTRPDLSPRYRRVAALSRELMARLEGMPGACQPPPMARFYETLRQNALYGDALAALSSGDQPLADARFSEYCRLLREREPRYQADFDVYRAIVVGKNFTGFHETDAGGAGKQ